MPLQMVDLHAQVASIRSELDAAIAAVLESTAFVRGPFVERFERELSDFHGGAPAVSCANGTDALQLAYMAAGVGPGDEVIVPSFTFVATAEAVSILGARPVFVDIDPATFNVDTEAVRAAVTSRTRAIVPVHLFGQTADLDPLLVLADERGLALIEDGAQSIGASYRGRPAGTLGRFGCLSFYPSKNLGAYGDAGAVLARDPADADAVRRLANHGTRRKYFHDEIGVNSRLDALQAAILSVKLPHLAAWTAGRQAAAARYDAGIAGRPALAAAVTPPARVSWGDHVFHQYVVRVPPETRDDLAAHLKSAGVPTMVYFPHPLHVMPAFSDVAPTEGALPETERACREVLALPMHPHLSEADTDLVLDTMEQFFGR
jgi:dTDP-4-amino-4,6-dideoxygalactose transaminase